MPEAEDAVSDALGAQGSGVLTEIDVAATLAAILGIERSPLKILCARQPAPGPSRRPRARPERPLLDNLAHHAARGRDAFVAWLAETTGLTSRWFERLLDNDADTDTTRLLRAACDNDESVTEPLTPYVHRLRRERGGSGVSGRHAGGRLVHGSRRRHAPSGDRLADAITDVDATTDAFAAYDMLNCAHPTRFASVLEPGAAWSAGSVACARMPRR